MQTPNCSLLLNAQVPELLPGFHVVEVNSLEVCYSLATQRGNATAVVPVAVALQGAALYIKRQYGGPPLFEVADEMTRWVSLPPVRAGKCHLPCACLGHLPGK